MEKFINKWKSAVLVPLNDFVVFENPPGFSDVYFNGPEESLGLYLRQQMISLSLGTKKSWIDLLFLFMGLLILATNVYQSSKRKKAQADEPPD